MRGNLPGPEGLARRGASAALHGLPVVPPRAAPRALHPLPCTDPMLWAKPNCTSRIHGLANAAHAEYSDRLLASGLLGRPTELHQLRHDGVSMVALDFDDAVAHRAPRAAALLESG